MNFYLNYGVKGNKNIDEVLTIIIDLLDNVKAEKRESDYYGEYYKCFGMAFDTLKIYKNNEELIQFPDEHIIVITLSISTGRNKDRKSKYKFVKKAFEKNNEFEIFKDNIVEE